MRPVRLSLLFAGLIALCACGGIHSFSAGVDPNSSAAAGGQGVAVAKEALALSSKETHATKVVKVAAAGTDAAHGDKLIALTFDDGPRPYVLFGSKGDHRGPGLVDILDQNGVKATFFVVGWRLSPKTWGEPKHEENIGVSCLDAAGQLIRRGHELEDHTYSHLELRTAERRTANSG